MHGLRGLCLRVATLHIRYKPRQHAALDALVAIAPWQLADIPAPLRAHAAQIDNWVLPRHPAPDARARLRAAHGIPPDAWVFGAVGRVEQTKGLDFLLDAFQQAGLADAWLVRFQQTLAPTKPIAPATPAGKTKLYGSRLLLNRHLNPLSPHKETRQFALDLAGSGLTYEAGDALGVRPRNCPELVNELLDLTRLNAHTSVNIETFGDVPLQQALTQHFEIARPSSDTLAFIAERSANPGLKHLLNPEHKAELNDWLWGRQLADVLQAYPIECSADELLGTLKRLQPRLYSIASSAKAYPQEVHLTVAAVRYGKRKGVSSTFLADRVGDGEVPLFVQPSKHFRTPTDGDVPMIMIGPGTGIAPFRAFLQERRALGHQGRNWLFFGEQHAASDFYYQDELQGMQRDGLLNHLSLAFSRDQAQKVYVQDRIREQGAELWRWLQDGARLYICGDASHMAKDVDQALRQVAQTHGGLGVEGAVEYWRQLSEQKRYLRDVY